MAVLGAGTSSAFSRGNSLWSILLPSLLDASDCSKFARWQELAGRVPVALMVHWAAAQTGLAYSQNPYDLERFTEVRAIAEQGLAELLRASPEAVTEHYALERGYPTPKIDVRTAVFSEERILLVRESADGLWTMPGGWADDSDSPRHAAEQR
jgi:hypothetical protein